MKNIHILTTSKLSRLIKDIWKKTFSLVENFNTNHTDFKAHHIYITSNEEIKEGDWILVPSTDGETYFDFRESVPKKAKCNYASNKFVFKIILTTDQDLIKDGVQAIDDDFLEWFIKNPSCEEVEVELEIIKRRDTTLFVPPLRKYKIIIPKEETISEKLEKIVSKEPSKFVEESNERFRIREEKKLKEAFDEIYNSIDFTEFDFASFKLGVKWEQERNK